MRSARGRSRPDERAGGADPPRLYRNFVNLSDSARHVGDAYIPLCTAGVRRPIWKSAFALRLSVAASSLRKTGTHFSARCRLGGAMIRLFKHYVPYPVLLLGLIDFALLMVAAQAGWAIRLWQMSG